VNVRRNATRKETKGGKWTPWVWRRNRACTKEEELKSGTKEEASTKLNGGPRRSHEPACRKHPGTGLRIVVGGASGKQSIREKPITRGVWGRVGVEDGLDVPWRTTTGNFREKISLETI